MMQPLGASGVQSMFATPVYKKRRKREKKIPASYPESNFDIPVSTHISSFIIFKNGVK